MARDMLLARWTRDRAPDRGGLPRARPPAARLVRNTTASPASWDEVYSRRLGALDPRCGKVAEQCSVIASAAGEGHPVITGAAGRTSCHHERGGGRTSCHHERG